MMGIPLKRLRLVAIPDNRICVVDRSLTDKGPLNRTVCRIDVEIVDDQVVVVIDRNDKDTTGPVAVVWR